MQPFTALVVAPINEGYILKDVPMKENEALNKVVNDALIKAGVSLPFLEAAKENLKELFKTKKDDEILSAISEWSKTEDIKNYILAPINCGGGATGGATHWNHIDRKDSADWDLWAFIPHCEVWQAVALSLDIEPPKYSHEVRGWPPDYDRRLKITSAHIECRSLARSKTDINNVDLTAFSTWAQSLSWSLPDRFPIGSEVKAPAAANEIDNDELLSELFDPVKVEVLDKMFPRNGGTWSSWTEKASSNKLITARDGRGLFNPYKAAIWFVSKGESGWDLARCYRTLSNNLPARSRDKKNLLTGVIE